MSSFINRNYPIRKPGGSKPCTLFEVAGLILGITELSDCEPCSPSCKSTALDITTVRHTTQETKCHSIGDCGTCLVWGKQSQKNTIKAEGLQRQATSD